MAKSKKKPTKKQLAARAKFTKIMKSGGFKKKKKSTTKTKKTKTRRARGGAASDIPKEARALLLAIKDPNIKEIVIRK